MPLLRLTLLLLLASSAQAGQVNDDSWTNINHDARISSKALTIDGGSFGRATITMVNNGSQQSVIQFSTTVFLLGTGNLGSGEVGWFTVYTNAKERMFVTANGSVGIQMLNAQEPGTSLQVDGDAQFGGTSVKSTMTYQGAVHVGLDLSVADSVVASSQVTISGGLTVTGANVSTFQGPVFANDSLTVNGDFSMAGALGMGVYDIATIQSIPSFDRAGLMVLCSDCLIPYTICITTGTVAHQLRGVGTLLGGCY